MAFDLQPLPPEEAMAYFRARGVTLAPSFDWRDVWQQSHATAFTVAKSAGFDILGDIFPALDAAMAEGTTLRDFVARVRPVLQEKGWWGVKAVVDPLTGERRMAQLGSVRRLKTIFDVNLRTSYAAGQWAAIERLKERRPWLRYVAILDDRTRDQHRAWHGTVLRVDDPWWATHAPPNGWNCRCTVQQLSDRDLERFGFTPSDQSPPSPTKTWRNRRTGEVVDVPEGIDPGWGYNPGKAAHDEHLARVFAEKAVDAPPHLAAAAIAGSARFLLRNLIADFARWTDAVTAPGYRPIGERRVVGALSAELLDALEARGRLPASGALTLDDKRLLRMVRAVKPAGQAIPLAELRRMPELLAQPVAVLEQRSNGNLLYVFDPPAGPGARSGKLVVQVDAAVSRRDPTGAKRRMATNAIVSGGIVQPSNLKGDDFELLTGRL